jgi:LacI family transcriptional regulator, fructose operon transcriptional repressor
VKYVPPKMEAGYAAALKMIDTAEPPDALFTVNSLLAAELLLQRIADPGRSTRQVILKGQLLVRRSSTPRR